MEWLGIIGPVKALLVTLGALFNFSVIKPLNNAIKNLSNAIEHMQMQLQDVDNKRQKQAERLATVESSVKSAHHRIDTLEGRMNHDV